MRLRVILGEETVGSMGYVNDTAAAAAAPAKEVAEITQHLADTLRSAIHTLGQRNHSGKMKVLGFKVENDNIAVHKFKVKWGADKVTTENRHAHIKLLGGNVNITGGYAAIRKVIKTWTNRVIGQLARWPVSAGVTIAVIEGLVENRMVYKCVVNIPTEGRISELTGMVTRAFRGAFGIPRRTPRECVYDIIGRPGPDTLMWVTAIVEYHKAMNSPSQVLNETTWVHWQSEDLHRWDKDVRRLRARVHNMGIKFIRVESQQGEVWTLRRQEENTAVRVLYIFGDASNIEQWGGAAMVVDEEGNVWLKKRVTIKAQGLSTKLVEATMIVMALEAVLQAIRKSEVTVQKVWAWSDSLEAIQSLASGQLQQRPASIMDRIIATGQETTVPLEWGWVQAQHDSQQQDWISQANQEMDKEAKEGAKGRGTPLRLPQVWTDGAVVLPFVNNEVIIDIKKYLLQHTTSALRSEESDRTPAPQQRTWTRVFPEAKEAQKAWQRLQPLSIRDWGEIRTWSLYAEAAEWEWEGKQQHCEKCGLWCERQAPSTA